MLYKPVFIQPAPDYILNYSHLLLIALQTPIQPTHKLVPEIVVLLYPEKILNEISDYLVAISLLRQ